MSVHPSYPPSYLVMFQCRELGRCKRGLTVEVG